MNKTPYISVVIPVYNKEPHINRSISSVLEQTFQNFELILINDASTDNSLEEIQKFTDERIRLFQRTEPGPGGYAARNLGIKNAKGDWIAFLDADDEWYPNHLKKMHELALKYPGVFFMGCGWQTQNNGVKKENTFYKEFNAHGKLKITVEDYLKHALKKKLPVWTSVAYVKSASPVTENLFPADLGAKRGGDLHAWLKLICHHKEMAWSNHIGAVYHTDSVNMVTKKSETSHQLREKRIYNLLTEKLNENERKLLLKYFNQQIFNAWKGTIIRNQKKYSIHNKLFWRNNTLYALKLFILTLLPIKFLYWLKQLVLIMQERAIR